MLTNRRHQPNPPRSADQPICRHGHDPAREHRSPDGRRYCRDCWAERDRAKLQARKDAIAAALMADINRAVPRNLPADIRADVVQELAVRLLEKRIERRNLQTEARAVLRETNAAYANKYGPLSLDTPTRDGRRLGDVIGAY
jgi:hypothetical protein